MSTPLVQAEAWCKITFPFDTTSLNGMFSPIVLESRDFFWINLRLTEIPCQCWCSNRWPTVSCTFCCMAPSLSCGMIPVIDPHSSSLSFRFYGNFHFHHSFTHLFHCIFNSLSTVRLNWEFIKPFGKGLKSKPMPCKQGHSNGEVQLESPCSRHVLVAGTADVLLLCWMLCTFNMGEKCALIVVR